MLGGRSPSTQCAALPGGRVDDLGQDRFPRLQTVEVSAKPSFRLPGGGIVVAALLALSGCGDGFAQDEPPKPPSEQRLSHIVAATQQPAYWLGESFREIAISAAATAAGRVAFSYGPWSCDSGCTDIGGVATGPRDTGALVRIETGGHVDPRTCWSRAGRAVVLLVDCSPGSYPQELLVFTGSQQVSVTSLYTRDGRGEIAAREVLRALRPLNGNAAWPLSAPTRLTCKEFRRMDGRYRRHAPFALRPRTDCGLARRSDG